MDADSTGKDNTFKETANQMIRFCLRYVLLLTTLPVISGCTGNQGHTATSNRITDRALLSYGNDFRIRSVIKRAAAGEPITIAVIGGSITEGYNAPTPEESWPVLTAESFRKHFGRKTTVRLINAGMAGTPSTLGMIRYKRDVLEHPLAPPDLVIVEFAVNDGDDPTGGAAYESLIGQILAADNKPAVILLFSVFENGWNLEERLIPIGEQYGLPMISIKRAIMPEIEEESLKSESFFADAWHPTATGHRIMADCLDRYFTRVKKERPTQRETPIPDTPVIGRQFTDIRMIDSHRIPEGIIINRGSFRDRDSALGTFKYDGKRTTFPDNWCKKNTPDNEPFIMTLKAKNLFLIYKRTASAAWGTAHVYVDGELTEWADGQVTGGWDNPWTTLLLDDQTSREHTIEIRMAEGDERKNFTILGFGYTP